VCSLWVGLGFFVLLGLGSCGFVWWVSFFLFWAVFFFVFQLCVFSCILPVYYGAPDAFNKTRLLLNKKKSRDSLFSILPSSLFKNQPLEIHTFTHVGPTNSMVDF